MKRTRHEIRADILRIAHYGALKTEIVYGANLNFKVAQKHIDALITSNKLFKTDKKYFMTAKGFDYIANVEALK